MNPQLKQSWIEALRSGRYLQGRGLLRQRWLIGGAYFCAMGVLFDLIATAAQWDRMTRRGSRAGVVDEVPGYIPAEILGEIGMTGMQQAAIAGLNDAGKTFEQIAAVIEKDFEDELRLCRTAFVMEPSFVAPPLPVPAIPMPQPLPDWSALAGIKPSAAVSTQPMTMYTTWA